MRRGAALLAVALLAVTAGCVGAFSGSLSEEELDAEPAEPYEWDAETTGHITVTEDATFRAVYEIPTNQSEMRLYRSDRFGGTNPIPLRSVRYQYPNGTVITAAEFEAHGGSIERTNDEVLVVFPHDEADWDNETAQFAFTSDSTPKRFTLPAFQEGSYELVLPPNRSVEFFLFGNVIPRDHERTVTDHRTHIYWDHISSGTIVVQFYLQRDLYIFGGFFGLAGLAAIAGILYYRRQIEELEQRREAAESGRDGDPPGN